MKIYSVFDPVFASYGKVIDGYDFSEILEKFLLLGQEAEIVNGKFDTARVRDFLAPKGTAVELFATSLHYAPCGYRFRCLVALPRGTNTGKPAIKVKNQEDQMLWACNKWLLCHPEAEEAVQGAYIGLTGENLVVVDLI